MTASPLSIPHANHSPDYDHEVFISLCHTETWITWWEDIVLPMLRDDLHECLGDAKPRIYLAKHAIKPGDQWPVELAKNHARSKTMLAFCTNTYKYRDWCRLEFSMMRAREDKIGFRTINNSKKLLVPVIGGDCTPVPPFLVGLETIDVSAYAYPEIPPRCEAMWNLRKLVRIISEELAKAIKTCPAFDPNWETLNCEEFLNLFKTHDQQRRNRDFPGMDGK